VTQSIQQITLEILEPDRHTHEDTLAEIARRLHAEVGAPDQGLFDVRVEADTRDEALQRVADVLAEMGVEEHFTFPSTTGTDYHPPGHRAPPPDEEPDDADEPPHLQGGSPHENVPEPYDEPPRDIP
jgi:hypothetical protein